MKKEHNENLKEILAKFLNTEEASKTAQDIIEGERIFDATPAPGPSPVLLAEIKKRMITAAGKNRRQAKHFVLRYAAVAAVIVIVLGAGITLLQRHGGQYNAILTSESFWQETPENSIDSQMAQIEQPETDAPLITLEANGNDVSAVSDIMDELDDINGTFWEG